MPAYRFKPTPLAFAIARIAATAFVGAPLLLSAAHAQTATRAPAVEVISTTPVPGVEQRRDEIPSPVRSLGAENLRENRSSTLSGLLGEQLPNVSVNEIQGNPFHADVNFRGFTASPLLGTPQGLSIYQDGVRINEPFGDIVNWDLIPRSAIRSIDLIPGSNPLFGLNTLGGALSIHTKSGLTDQGSGIEVSAGSFGRRNVEFESGHKFGDMGFFISGSLYDEDGWRDHSPSDATQLFAKLSRQTQTYDFDLSVTHADTDLIGNGLLPTSMLERNRKSIFTRPDNTLNRMSMVTLNASYWLTADSRLSGTVYARHNLTRTLNGDANDEFAGSANDGAGAGPGVNDETAVNNRTRTKQRSFGGALQWSQFGEKSQTALGVTADGSRADFEQSSEEGIFDASRAVINGGGTQLDNQITGRTRSYSLFATHTFKPLPGLAATVSGRFNHTHVKTADLLNPGVPGNLDNNFTYRKFNPSLGATYALTPSTSVYANAGQGNRTPSPIELACADRLNPCSLPNAMQADPFLEQVVTRSFETGVRGRSGNISWDAGLFHSRNHDDIIFVGTGGGSSQGFFTNFGKTQRQGIELSATAGYGRVNWRASYGFIRATYESSACLIAESNSSAGSNPACAADEILVTAGNRMPGIPEHSLKLGLDYRVGDNWTLSADMLAYSSQYVRGNENNAHAASGATDPGKLSGYEIFNVGARGKLGAGWEGFIRINNLFDKKYASAGALGENPFDANGVFQTDSDNWSDETFQGPGAPRSAWIGVRYQFGK